MLCLIRATSLFLTFLCHDYEKASHFIVLPVLSISSHLRSDFSSSSVWPLKFFLNLPIYNGFISSCTVDSFSELATLTLSQYFPPLRFMQKGNPTVVNSNIRRTKVKLYQTGQVTLIAAKNNPKISLT